MNDFTPICLTTGCLAGCLPGCRTYQHTYTQLHIPVRDTLRFTNISRNYSGEYNCTIQDDCGDTISSAEIITIQCKQQ